ncbi:unnamed protein product [Meganyctiphanes norvegica]|uniref:ShKT domain-containing protein n=1 Tax=Meganyctiphanes norvegica TaxID=48144 RepID=A0AAV2Q1F6_MEGNR
MSGFHLLHLFAVVATVMILISGTQAHAGTAERLPVECEDSVPDCANWAKEGQCYKNPGFMKVQCRVSCSNCQEDPNCRNFHDQCDSWAHAEECQLNPCFMAKNCANACGWCIPAFAEHHDANLPHIDYRKIYLRKCRNNS